MQNITTSGQTGQASANNYSASVPISVYREATAELQATQIKLESLKVHNEHLIQQNQKLRREIEKVVNSGIHLQEALNEAQLATQVAHPPLISSFHNSQIGINNASSNSYFNSDVEPNSEENLSPSSPSLPFSDSPSTEPDFPEQLFTEESDQNRYSRFSSAQISELNGIWLVVAFCFIVIAAFGAGYWVVRPILQQRSR
ncbi:MAG: hypothetical protein WBA93_08350 [Microcoleaceae cyanobacterium]